jgi:hypothetical protein
MYKFPAQQRKERGRESTERNQFELQDHLNRMHGGSLAPGFGSKDSSA